MGRGPRVRVRWVWESEGPRYSYRTLVLSILLEVPPTASEGKGDERVREVRGRSVHCLDGERRGGSPGVQFRGSGTCVFCSGASFLWPV